MQFTDKLELVIDEYKDNLGQPAQDKRSGVSGVTLPAEPCLKTNRDLTAILALVTLCKTWGGCKLGAGLVP